MGDDESLLGIVTSANVACGFHAGDAVVMGRTCEAAAEHGVCVGAHVAYRDLAGFGRNFIDVDPGRLRDEVIYQLSALRGVAAALALGLVLAAREPLPPLLEAMVQVTGHALDR